MVLATQQEGGDTHMIFLKWLRRFWFKLRIEFTAGLSDKSE
jgi:hypothetical protein